MVAVTADVGAVGTDMLVPLILAGQVPKDSLAYIDRAGRAVPLLMDENPASTDVYPGWVLSKTEAVPDELGQRVADALMQQDLEVKLDQVSYRIH